MERGLRANLDGAAFAPVPVDAQGSDILFKGCGINAAFRFAVIQGRKVRACDDMRHSLTDRGCDVLTPIKLAPWGRVAHISNLFAAKGLGCNFPKADHRDAYKSLPVCPRQTKLAVVVRKNPDGGKWYAITGRTLLFGSISSVLHYNILSRGIAELMGEISGIPLACFFFDDFGDGGRELLAMDGIWRFQQFCDICGIDLKAGKPNYVKK